jgi:hypothetical protein
MSDRDHLEHSGHHDPDRISTRAVALVAVALTVCVAVLGWGVRYFAREMENTPTPAPAAHVETFERRVHWEFPQADLARVRAAEDAHLQGYRWIDREKDVVQLPIERAMELVAAGAKEPPAAGKSAE